MTGNDVVDMVVAATESNWRRKGFVEKVFSLQEQAYISLCSNPGEMVWKLWSMKESAYKLYCRLDGGRFFAPQKFCCTLLAGNKGLVNFTDFCCHTVTYTTNNYVYSIARKSNFQHVNYTDDCFYVPQSNHTIQQQFIYKKIVERYQLQYANSDENVFISKDKYGIPFLNTENNLIVPVSITHHGRFAAFTIY